MISGKPWHPAAVAAIPRVQFSESPALSGATPVFPPLRPQPQRQPGRPPPYIGKLLPSGLIAGKNPRVLARAIKNVFGQSTYNCERLMRTEMARVQTEAQRQSFVRNGFDQYEFIANSKRCDICAECDGKHFNVDDMMPGENAPPMHPNCRCSVAAWEDSEEYEAWLDHLANGGTTAEWDALKKSGNLGIIEPADERPDGTSKEYTERELIDLSNNVHEYLETLGLPQSKWSGNTFVKGVDEMPRARGIKKRTCDIWLRADAGIKTIIHEHLHSRSSSWAVTRYRKDRGFEEGACELLAEEICRRNGIPFKPTYRRFVDPLRRINEIVGTYDSDYDFAIDLFAVDMDKREDWLKSLYSGQNPIKTIQVMYWIKKVRYND